MEENYPQETNTVSVCRGSSSYVTASGEGKKVANYSIEYKNYERKHVIVYVILLTYTYRYLVHLFMYSGWHETP